VVVNDAATAVTADLALNPALWLPEGTRRVRRFDAEGKLTGQGEVVVTKGQASPVKGRRMAPGDMEYITIE
jgi:hypothetical protein